MIELIITGAAAFVVAAMVGLPLVICFDKAKKEMVDEWDD